jgi:perosamine synthetase
MTDWKVPFCEPSVERHANVVAEQVRSGWVGPGPRVEELEARLVELTGSPRVVCTSSGTAALWAVARHLLPRRRERERRTVLVPGYGVSATGNAWRAAGWFLNYGDVDPRTGCLRPPEDLTRYDAVCYVNFSGRTDQVVVGLRETCDAANVPLVEDAACGLGHRWDGRHAGTIGWFGALSFSVPKLVTGGQGGAVFCASEHGYDAAAIRALISNDRPGALNLRMTDLQAALILAQLDELDQLVDRKKDIHRQILSTATSGHILEAPSGFPLHNVLLAEPHLVDETLTLFHDRGIEARRQYEAFAELSGCQTWADQAIYLPFGNALTDEQVALVCEALRSLNGG